jgi:hypothetical protein
MTLSAGTRLGPYEVIAPDGRRVVVQRITEGNIDVWLLDSERGVPTPFTFEPASDYGAVCRRTDDGEELFYLAPDQRLMAVAITVAADGQTLTGGEPSPLFMTHLAQGAAITGTRSQYAVAADGRFLMNVIAEETAPTPPISVIVNWTARLNK